MLRLARRLDDRFRVVRYDRRGYGRSRPHPGPYGMRHQVSDLGSVVAGRRVVVVGHSYGGNVALAFASQRADQVDAVVVYEPPLSWVDWWPGSTAGSTALALGGSHEEAGERFMRRLIGDERWERLPPSTRAARRAEGVAMVGELEDLRQAPPWAADEVDVPVLALRGEHGAAHHRRAVDHLAKVLPRCHTSSISGARHFGPNTHPGEVAAAIVDHLERVAGEHR